MFDEARDNGCWCGDVYKGVDGSSHDIWGLGEWVQTWIFVFCGKNIKTRKLLTVVDMVPSFVCTILITLDYFTYSCGEGREMDWNAGCNRWWKLIDISFYFFSSVLPCDLNVTKLVVMCRCATIFIQCCNSTFYPLCLWSSVSLRDLYPSLSSTTWWSYTWGHLCHSLSMLVYSCSHAHFQISSNLHICLCQSVSILKPFLY